MEMLSITDTPDLRDFAEKSDGWVKRRDLINCPYHNALESPRQIKSLIYSRRHAKSLYAK